MFQEIKNKLAKYPLNDYVKKTILRGLDKITNIIKSKKKEVEADKALEQVKQNKTEEIREDAERAEEHAQINFGNQWGPEGSKEAEEKMHSLSEEAREIKEESEDTKKTTIDVIADEDLAINDLDKTEDLTWFEDLVEKKSMEPLVDQSKTKINDDEMNELEKGMKEVKKAYNYNVNEEEKVEIDIIKMKKQKEMERSIEHDLEGMIKGNVEEGEKEAIEEKAKEKADSIMHAPKKEEHKPIIEIVPNLGQATYPENIKKLEEELEE